MTAPVYRSDLPDLAGEIITKRITILDRDLVLEWGYDTLMEDPYLRVFTPAGEFLDDLYMEDPADLEADDLAFRLEWAARDGVMDCLATYLGLEVGEEVDE